MTHPERPRLGLLYRPTDVAMPVVEVALAAEERGFDAIMVAEHTHIPVSRETPYPAGGDLPELYKRLLDPFVALSFVAASTSLSIGTGISLVAQHDPIALAKTAATLDFMSNGRFSLGVGFGWNREELENHGHAFGRRRQIVREHVELMRALWTVTEASYEGDHVRLAPSWSWPKPIQQPSLPVLLGAQPTERNMQAIVEWADGWIPGGSDPDWLAAALASIRARWSDAGREATGPIVWVMQQADDDETLRSQLERFRALSIDTVLIDVPTGSSDDVLPVLDRCAAVGQRAYR